MALPKSEFVQLEYSPLNRIEAMAERLEEASPQQVLLEAFNEFGDGVAIATGFGAEGAALIDMAVKINPLVRWTKREVWNYIAKYDVPYNPLHDAGYPSIGCTHCTRAVRAGENERAGRWAGQVKTECGLHGDAPKVVPLKLQL